MAINKKFIHFKRKSTFQRELEAGNILNTSIVFIADAKLIYLNGSYFSENTLFNLSDLLSTVSGDLTDTDTSNEAIVKLYKYLKEIDSNTDSLIKVLMLEVSTLEETLTKRIDSTDLLVATELSNINQRLNTSENEITRLSESFKETDSITKILVEEVPSIELTLTNRIDNTDLLVATELGNINQKLDNIENLINITYSELKSLRDSSKLVPGMQYRITDYEFTTINEKMKAKPSTFDIIVTADDKYTLNLNARAIVREGVELSEPRDYTAWELKYTLDNVLWSISTEEWIYTDLEIEYTRKGTIEIDGETWALWYNKNSSMDFGAGETKGYVATLGDVVKNETMVSLVNIDSKQIVLRDLAPVTFYNKSAQGGKGTILWLKDEYLNEAYYDHHNALIKTYKVTACENSPAIVGMYIVDSGNLYTTVDKNAVKWMPSFGARCYKNKYGKNTVEDTMRSARICINVLYDDCHSNTFEDNCKDNTLGDKCYSNVFLKGCSYNTFRSNCYYNTFESYCSSNVFGNSCSSNTFESGCRMNMCNTDFDSNKLGIECESNKFGNLCTENTFGSNCGSNTFGDGCNNNTFGNHCNNNTFGSSCNSNTFGNDCGSNSFGESCSSNTFGNDCDSNTFKNDCKSNTFENVCKSNSFGINCQYNSFGYNCSQNTFGNNFYGNTFGNGCSKNTFGISCRNNSFGNDCAVNTFGTYCLENSFGVNCNNNSFGNDCDRNSFGNNCAVNTFGNYFKYNAIGNDVSYIEILTEKIYHTQILNGTKGTNSTNKLTIEFTPETTYSQFVGLTSNNVLEIWVEADAPVSTINLTYNELKELRDNSNLKPSQYYRITDFVTTVANDQKAQSARHPFDIIVLALDKNKLQEECLAIQHTGDSYFANNNLSAWRLWYCLDNDTTRFTWADSTNGKGVIYRLIDEFGNECPYDFKNVLFARWLCEDTVNGDMFEELTDLYLYWNTTVESGFTLNKVTPISVDSTLRKFLYTFSTTSDTDNSLNSTSCRDNVITANSQYPISLSNVVIIGTATNNVLYKCSNISALEGFTRNRLDTCTNIIIGKAFDLNKLGVNSSYLIFGNSCSYNDFGRDCNYSHFFKNLWGNVFNASSYYFNSFGPNFSENVLAMSCGANKFEAGCGGNFLYADCEGNTFKANSSNNILYRNCDGLVINGSYNKFGAFCSNITINGNGNKFGDTCSNMTFPSLLCSENSFGDNCSNNTFKNYLSYNKFGNGFSSNTIGTSVLSGAEYNTFGENVSSVTIGNNFKNNKVNNFLLLVTIGDDVSNTNILLLGQLNNITLDITPNADYILYVSKTSSGLIKVWNPADLNVIAE